MKHIIFFILIVMMAFSSCGQSIEETKENQKTMEFLKEKKGKWTGYAVPYQDGEALYNLIVKKKYQNILEIGTSTGHSAIWLALAAKKTGGKVITLEINDARYKEALKNFKTAGVDEVIDARLGDAMDIIPTLEDNSIDFVFSDGTWSGQTDEFVNFFKACNPKLKKGGSYTMHNVTDGYGDDGRFFKYLDEIGGFKTHIIKVSSAGISVSVKE